MFRSARGVPTAMSHLHLATLSFGCFQVPLQLFGSRSWLPEGLKLLVGTLQLHLQPLLGIEPPHQLHLQLPLKRAAIIAPQRCHSLPEHLRLRLSALPLPLKYRNFCFLGLVSLPICLGLLPLREVA